MTAFSSSTAGNSPKVRNCRSTARPVRCCPESCPAAFRHRNLESLNDLLDRADRRSGCQVWSRVGSAAAVDFSRQTGSRGIGIVSLTDLLVSTGGIQELLAAIAAYGTNADAPAELVEEVVERISLDALRPLLTASLGVPVHVRVPTMTSPRARSWIHEWTALAPHLLVPLDLAGCWTPTSGPSRRPPKSTGHDDTTLLIGGITDATELSAFADMLGPGSPVAAGAVLQNPVVLHHPDRLTVGGHSLWVDLAELVRTSCGRPEELLYLTGNLAETADPSVVADPPDLRLPELITDQLGALVAATAGRSELGVEVAGHANPTFTGALYDLVISTSSGCGCSAA